MPTQRGEQHSWNSLAVDNGQPAGARDGLAEAVTELRRLTQNPSFHSVERILADLDHPANGSRVGIEAVHALRRWGAEHLRVADELEAAARCCRLVEREIDQRIDAFLVGWDTEPEQAHPPEPGSAGPRRRTGPAGWLRKLFRRGRHGQQRAAGRPVPAAHARRTPVVIPAGSPPPAPVVPTADVAAMVLGPLELSVAGRPMPRWNSLKARGVFQYLVIHQDRPVRRDALMELQWPDHTHNSARNNLNVAIYNLRIALDALGQGVQPILYRDGCYSLNPELTWWIDRNEFLSTLHRAESALRAGRPRLAIDAYEMAVQLYRGALFEDDCAGEWFLPERRHLEELYLQALERLATVYFDLGELPEAVRCGQLAVGTDPCCEPAHRLLMRCFGSQHQQQMVSRQYRYCVAALHDELGVPPGEETVQLFHSLTAAL
jgi:DNA-binding SARP family transcriptional activator